MVGLPARSSKNLQHAVVYWAVSGLLIALVHVIHSSFFGHHFFLLPIPSHSSCISSTRINQVKMEANSTSDEAQRSYIKILFVPSLRQSNYMETRRQKFIGATEVPWELTYQYRKEHGWLSNFSSIFPSRLFCTKKTYIDVHTFKQPLHVSTICLMTNT
jgi:hypothetical protein